MFPNIQNLKESRIRSKLEEGIPPIKIALWFASKTIAKVLSDYTGEPLEDFIEELHSNLILTTAEKREVLIDISNNEKQAGIDLLCVWLQGKSIKDVTEFVEMIQERPYLMPLAQYLDAITERCAIFEQENAERREFQDRNVEIAKASHGIHLEPSHKHLSATQRPKRLVRKPTDEEMSLQVSGPTMSEFSTHFQRWRPQIGREVPENIEWPAPGLAQESADLIQKKSNKSWLEEMGNISIYPESSEEKGAVNTIPPEPAQTEPVIPVNIQQLDRASLNIDRNIRLGRGQFGFVYKCELSGTVVAVKELEIPKKRTYEITQTLRNEILTSAAIRHPSVVQFMGYCIDTEIIPNCLLLAYEFIDGHNLDDILAEEELKDVYQLNLAKRCGVLLQTSEALAYLHGQNPKIIHGDIKPANLMLSKTGRIKVCDLGLSKFKWNNATSIVTTASSKGTPMYMAPEQLLDSKSSSTKSDVYSFGAVIYEVLFEDYLWDVDNFDDCQLLLDKMKEERIPHRLIQKKDHPAYIVIVKCVQFDHRLRPKAIELVEQLEQLCKSVN